MNSNTDKVKVLVLILLMFILISPISGVLAENTSDNMNVNKIRLLESKIDSISNKLNITAIISSASSSTIVKNWSKQFKIQYHSIYLSFDFDPSGHVKLKSINIVFSMFKAIIFKAYLIITENPNITTILNFSIQRTAVKHSITRSSPSWAGYSFSLSDNEPVTEAWASWHVPSVSEPWPGASLFTHNDLSVWTGLTCDYNGLNGIVQAGSDSGIYTFIYFYYVWYEFYPEPMVKPTDGNINPSDHIVVDIIYEGSKTYDIYIFDFTINKTWKVLDHYFDNNGKFITPYYGQFILERFQYGNESYARLPKFDSVVISGTIGRGNVGYSISLPYNDGTYVKWIMYNGGNTNIDLGPVNSTGYFTATWLTSDGT